MSLDEKHSKPPLTRQEYAWERQRKSWQDWKEHKQAESEWTRTLTQEQLEALAPPCPESFTALALEALLPLLPPVPFSNPQPPPTAKQRSRMRFEDLPEVVALRELPIKVRTVSEQLANGGYVPTLNSLLTTVHNHRRNLIQHRASKKEWKGRLDEYRAEERALVAIIQGYRDMLRDPYYRELRRVAMNKARRKKRKPLKAVIKMHNYGRHVGWREDRHKAHLPWMLTRIRKKRFKNVQHVATVYNKPLSWIKDALRKAVERALITEEELKTCFRGPGRPKTGKPRGPYRKKGTVKKHEVSEKVLKDLREV